MSYFHRMKDELKELQDKIARIEPVVRNGMTSKGVFIEGMQHDLMKLQLKAMKNYALILDARIRDENMKLRDE